MIEKKHNKLILEIDNINQAQAIALIKMFEYMEFLGKAGMSRNCSFFADGDGDFRPKIKYSYPENLPELKDKRIGIKDSGDFKIDYDSISWEIYHD